MHSKRTTARSQKPGNEHNGAVALHCDDVNMAMAIKKRILHEAQKEPGIEQSEVHEQHEKWKEKNNKVRNNTVNVNDSNDKGNGNSSNNNLLADPFCKCLQQ